MTWDEIHARPIPRLVQIRISGRLRKALLLNVERDHRGHQIATAQIDGHKQNRYNINSVTELEITEQS